MMYEHIVAKLRETYQDMDASFVGKHFAIQFNVWGEGHGALYMEIKKGHIYVEPYEYFDRDTLISTDADTLLGIAAGKIDPTTYGDLYVEGDFYALDVLKRLSFKGVGDRRETEVEESGHKPDKKGKAEKKNKKKKPTKKASARKTSGKTEETGKSKPETAAGAGKVKPEEAAGTVKEKAKEATEMVKEREEEAVETAETVKKKAGNTAEMVMGKAGSAAGTVREKVEEAAETMKEKAGGAAEAVKDKTRSKARSVRRKQQ